MIKELILLSVVPLLASSTFSGFATTAESPLLKLPPKTQEAPKKLRFEYIDAHADTITTAMETGQGLYSNDLHIDFERLMEFQSPVQVFTVWCDDKYVDNAFEYTNSAIDFFEKELEANKMIIELALTPEDVERIAGQGKISAILALEGAEPLEGTMENLEHFYKRGVRLITLTWNRENALGYGAGTETGKGLKSFGVECVERMNELGIIVDVSHLNEAGFWDVHRISEKPYMASHSNVYSVANHRRNLKDEQIEAIIENNGIIGLNLYPYFLTGTEKADTSDIIKHTDYFFKLGAESNLGLGCDFDGVDVLPEGITDISSLKTLNNLLTERYGKDASNAIMSDNFYSFLKRASFGHIQAD